MFIKGLLPMLKLAPLSLVFSLAIGVFGGVIRLLRIPILDQLMTVYIAVMRGLPILILLFIAHFVLPLGSNPFVAATVALSIYHGAYMIEIFRGGLQAVPIGQWEAARAIGLSFWRSIRLVILPQALLVVAPAVVGQLVILIKTTAVTSIIGYVEITRMGRSLMETLLMPLPIFGYIAIYYFVICHLLKIMGESLEQASRRRLQGRKGN